MRGTHTRLAPGDRAAPGGLHVTEIAVLAVLALATVMALSAPLFAIPLHRTGLNHVAFVLMVPVLVVHLIAGAVAGEPRPWARIAGITLPLLLLALFATAGSAVARWQLEVRETYLSFGLYLLLLLPLMAATGSVPAARVRAWVLALVGLWVLGSLAALAGEAARHATPETLHEIEYLVITGFFVLHQATRSRALQLLALVMLLAAAVLNHKLTGYIIAAMALLHIAVAAGWRALPREYRGLYGAGAAVFTVLVALLLVLAWWQFRAVLPSGNIEVRMAQYEAALRQFFESPWWGTAYTAGSGEGYREHYRLLNIPTHSDVLDMLKHGGLIGFSLFATGYAALFVAVQRAIRATQGDRLMQAYFTGVRFFQVTALVVFSLNPLLLKGPFLMVIWGHLGLALGLALAVTGRVPLARPPAVHPAAHPRVVHARAGEGRA